MLPSLGMPASESGTIPPARAMERSWAFGLPLHIVGEGCERNRPLQQSGCRARFNPNVIWPGGRSGLSDYFRARGSRSGSSSQTTQT
ncbi:hypothetical protein ACVWXQ_001341 [Bradyrhizobium sp. S3.14.4]